MRKFLLLTLSLFAIAIGANSQDMLSTPLTLEAVTEGDITFSVTYSYNHPVLLEPVEYQINGGEWMTYSSWPATADDIISSTGNWPVTFGDAIHVATGDKVSFRGTNASYYGNGTGFDSHIISTAEVYIYGNVMSLIHANDFATLKILTGNNAFAHLFSKPGENVWQVEANTTIKSHPTNDLLLPATTLTNMCYQYMFAGCQGLTRAPELPATGMTVACYASMFQDCTSLIKAPALPATTFEDYGFNEETMQEYGSIDCYMEMFKGCTSLTEAPALSATTLVHGVYQFMFEGCTSLTKAPVLPAAKVADLAYSNMFSGCTSLNYVKCLATEFMINPDFNNTEEDNVKDWLKDVSATGTFIKANEMAKWSSGDSGIPEGWTVKNANEEVGEFIANEAPLTLEATEDGTTVTVTNTNGLAIEYSTDGGNTWKSSSDATITISDIKTGGTVSFRGDNAAYSTNGLSAGSTKIGCSADTYVYGNVMSLINSTSFATLKEFTADYALSALFSGNANLKNHDTKELVLPATTLTRGCYRGMFSGNSGLTKAPVLPATKMAPLCYYFMFNNCINIITAPELPSKELADSCYMTMFQATGLTAAPVLPATTLANGCYYNMFRSCQSLATAPELPATTLAEGCYKYMFHSSAITAAPALPATTLQPQCYFGMFVNCTEITSAPELPATEMAKSCYLGMFYNSGLTKAPVLPATTLAPTCYKQMFTGCKSLTEVPNLPATTLTESCYEEMFKNCEALVDAPDLAAMTLAPTCCNFMFQGCSALTKAPKLPATKLETQCYQRMFDGCTSLVKAPELPATELADLCYNDMFWECTALKEAPVLPSTSLVDYCYTMMFYGCTSLETAPELPAAKLTPGCYEHMFMNCNKLNYVKCLATDLGDDTSTEGWMTNVASTGTFVKAADADWSSKGTTEGTWGEPEVATTFIHGIPKGWTVESVASFLLGDANKDGVVNANDILAITSWMMNSYAGDFDTKAADVNGDDKVNVADIIKLSNMIISAQ